jgi:hypothetical protein
MSITPSLPAETARVRFKTWVKSQWKLSAFLGQITVEINTPDPELDHKPLEELLAMCRDSWDELFGDEPYPDWMAA